MDTEIDDIPEGYEEIEVVSADEFNAEGGEDDLVEIDEEGNRLDPEDTPEPKTRKSDPDVLDADAFRRERDEARAELERVRREVDAGKNKNAWVERRQKINAMYDESSKEIFRLSNNADEPNDFIYKEFQKLNAWKDAEVDKEFGTREAGYMGEIVRLTLPQYAEKLGTDYRLKAADIKKIKEQKSPDRMEAMAEMLYELRRDEGRVATNNRKAAAHSRTAVSTSGGSRGSARKVKAGSDEHLELLLAGGLQR
jgi:hypothetical protein